MSKTLAAIIAGFAGVIAFPQKPRRRLVTLAGASHALQPIIDVASDRGAMRFACPTPRSAHDPLGFGSDEPETVAWLNDTVKSGTLWDIGANVGIYTVYAALSPDVNVVAIEPSAATFSVLVRNIELNALGAKVQPFCLALDEVSRVAFLHMAHSEAGHAMHAFGAPKSIFGDINAVFAQPTLGLTIDQLAEFPGVWPPDYIKLDVDSIEAQILRGGRKTMERVKSVIIEIMGEGEGPDGPLSALAELGFVENVTFREMGGRNRVFDNGRP